MNWAAHQESIAGWLSGRDGSQYLAELRAQCGQLMPSVFGYVGLQIGVPIADAQLLLHEGLLKSYSLSHTAHQGSDLIADPQHLPFASHSVNCIMLFNVLESVEDPHQVLREVDRVLAEDGHLIVAGFNPYSRHGLKRLLPYWGKGLPRTLRIPSVTQLRDWLSVLNIQAESPLAVGGLSQYRAGRSRWMQFLSRPFADGYIIKAKKRSIAGTVVRSNRRLMARGRKVIHAVFVGENRGQRRVEED